MSRKALVTGGTRGIGAAIARQLKAAGYVVAVNYRTNDSAALAFNRETGVPTYKWNVADYAASESAVRQIAEDLGGPVEVLVNNAGITRDAALHKMTSEQWRDVIDTDLTSCFNMCRVTIPSMRDRGFGRIVNIASINGQKGQFGQTNYCAAKAGMLGFTKALALESAAKGITVNAVAPGYVNTDMLAVVPKELLVRIVSQIPVGRLGEADEIARVVAFLASDGAAFITGATLAVNGGQYLT
jgi:acetoacetyl-CoA reductase